MTALRNFYFRLIQAGPRSLCDRTVFAGLWLLSCGYGLAVALRLQLFRLGLKATYSAGVPVISVGNLSVGGTGKTPMVDFLAKWMLRQQLPTAIVSRGYGGSYKAAFARVNPAGAPLMSPAECGDEPFLLARRNPSVPVFVARRRRLGVKAAEASGAKIILLDDGFQHRAVHRDLDIVLLDSERPFGNGHLLPAGPLREPQDALQRSHLLVMTRAQAGAESVKSGPPTLFCNHVLASEATTLSGEVIPLTALIGKSCVAFAGIARPDEFFSALKGEGLTLALEIPLVDHQSYDAALIEHLKQVSRGFDALITTEKDAVKLAGAEFLPPCYQVGVALAFTSTQLLDAKLQELVARVARSGEVNTA